MNQKLDQSEIIRNAVQKRYSSIALKNNQEQQESCCGSKASSCCGEDSKPVDHLNVLGYSDTEQESVPSGSNLGLGCGNPISFAKLKPGEVVLDLGSGAGFDCFLASPQVGSEGSVIGVDMTAEMISKARKNAAKGGYKNVEFRLGEIEHLPLSDSSVDVIISNCVINLSTEKLQVFKEAARVLKPGGRLAISDVVTDMHLPDEIKGDLALHCGCLAGASLVEELKASLKVAGFESVSIRPKEQGHQVIKDWAPDLNLEQYVYSAIIEAVKP